MAPRTTMGRRRGLVHISCELFLACVFVSSRDAPTLAITTTDLKPLGLLYLGYRSRTKQIVVTTPQLGVLGPSRGFN